MTTGERERITVEDIEAILKEDESDDRERAQLRGEHEVAPILGHTRPALVLAVCGRVMPARKQRARSITEELLTGAGW